MTRYVFVGERQSPTAHRNGWTWADGRVCARTLHEALRACGLDPERQVYLNAFTYDGQPNRDDLDRVQVYAVFNRTIVALGQLASKALKQRGIAHLLLVHPAARGAIRKRERYHAHVAETLVGGGAA